MASAELEQVFRYLDQHRPKERTLPGVRAYLDAMVSMEPVAGGVPAERVTTPGHDPSATFVYFHGGGYALGSAKAYRAFAGRLARAFGGPVVVPDYRLAPENPFPAGLDDAVSLTRALLATSGGSEHVVIGGDSAGGGLALGALLTLRDAGGPLPAAAALLSPWVDLEGSGESMTTRAALDPIVSKEGMVNLAQMVLGDRDRKNPLIAATYADLAGLPPLLMHVGTREMQFDDAHAFVAKVRAAGVPIDFQVWDDMIHVFQLFPVLPDAQRAIDRIGSFLRAKVS
jgi:acetyl esterase/lipase